MTEKVMPSTGATLKPGPMLTVVAERTVTDEQLEQVGAGTGLNAPFLADQLSAWITHQRWGVNLFRMLRSRTSNPALQGLYETLLRSSQGGVATWEHCIERLGGNPQYASPAARATEAMDSKVVDALLLPGSADPMTFETAGLKAAYTATTLAVLHAETLQTLAEEADASDAKDVLQTAATELVEVNRTGRDQVRKALDTAVSSQAKHSTVQKAGQVAEKAFAAVKDTLT